MSDIRDFPSLTPLLRDNDNADFPFRCYFGAMHPGNCPPLMIGFLSLRKPRRPFSLVMVAVSWYRDVCGVRMERDESPLSGGAATNITSYGRSSPCSSLVEMSPNWSS